MDWYQVGTIIGVNIALFGALATLIVWVVNKMDNDVTSACNRLDGHAMRIDQLYRMFCDNQKEADKKFYELLKERK
jgi:uncharacterized membrane protein YhiD involved in acid resistance